MTEPPTSFTCPSCGATSYHPSDVQHCYCGRCREWTRPRVGSLKRVDGTVIALRFVPTGDPQRFLAVTVDGDRIVCRNGDRVTVDVLGAGQSVVFGASLPDYGRN